MKFNNRFAVFLIVIHATVWGLHASAFLTFPNEVIGATIVTFTTIVNFYYRKKPAQE